MDIQQHQIYIPERMLFQWHITNRCNLRCAHCYQENYSSENEIDYEGPLRILEQFVHFVEKNTSWPQRRSHITVSGGEPFIREDFFQLLEEFHKLRRYFTFGILSNGTFIDEAEAHRLATLEPVFVQLSLDGKPQTHDTLRGAGSFDKTCQAARLLTDAGISVLISFTAHRGNFREFPEVYEASKAAGVFRVWSDRLIPCGSGAQMADMMLSPEETHEYFELMQQCQQQPNRQQKQSDMPWYKRFPLCTLPKMSSGAAKPDTLQLRPQSGPGQCQPPEVPLNRALQFLTAGGKPYHCSAGNTLLTIMPNGDLYPCRRMPIRVGNLFETPLPALYNENSLLQALRDPNSIPEECRGCLYQFLCGGGLRCLSYAVSGNPFTKDPGCFAG